jgi:oxalate---CoA ligase
LTVAAPSDIAVALHTTGSTGTPKVVLLTHRNMCVSSQNIIESYQLNEVDRCLLVIPLFHVHGLIGCLLSTLASGGTVVLPSQFSATAFWPICVAHQCTWYSAVPTLHIMLLERECKQPSPFIRNHRLRFIRSSSSYLAPSICQSIENAFHAPVLQAYGMTEASHQVTTNQLHACKKGSVGRAVGSVQIAIWHSDVATDKPNTIGEVLVRGETVMYGYRNVLPSSTGFTEEDRWFKTGDIGYIDSEGFLFLQGRSKHMINRGGEKISPLEVTSVLLSHPRVSDAIAFAFPHPIYGESVHAAVVSSSPFLTESELIDYCQSHLATFKCPERIYFLDQLPQTATGKIHLPSLIRQLQSSSKL